MLVSIERMEKRELNSLHGQSKTYHPTEDEVTNTYFLLLVDAAYCNEGLGLITMVLMLALTWEMT